MKNEEIIVLDTSDEAAQLKTVTGWFSRNGRFYGNDEKLARFDGCTHKKCECGNLMTRSYIKCDSCRAKLVREEYFKLQFVEWKSAGTNPVCIYRENEYFFDDDSIEDYLSENEMQPEDLMLVVCSPNYTHTIDSSVWEDVLAEDQDIPKELQEKINEVNVSLKNCLP
jgi:hypothetical protein